MDTIDFEQAIPFIKAFCQKLSPAERRELFSIVLSSFDTCYEIHEACVHHFKWEGGNVWLLSVDFNGLMKGFLTTMETLDTHVYEDRGKISVVADRIRKLGETTRDIVSHLERQRYEKEPDCTSR